MTQRIRKPKGISSPVCFRLRNRHFSNSFSSRSRKLNGRSFSKHTSTLCFAVSRPVTECSDNIQERDTRIPNECSTQIVSVPGASLCRSTDAATILVTIPEYSLFKLSLSKATRSASSAWSLYVSNNISLLSPPMQVLSWQISCATPSAFRSLRAMKRDVFSAVEENDLQSANDARDPD